MKRIILSGCCGAMGKTVASCIQERGDCQVVAGFDRAGVPAADFPVFAEPADCTVPFDVLIDFSHPAYLEKVLEFAITKKRPAVIATTGFGEEQIARIHEAAKQIPVFFSANMSLGVNLLVELSKKCAAILGEQFDIEIIEQHHNKKIDSPSGTALMLADAISDTLPTPPQYTYDRHAKRVKRGKNEIGIHSVRGGSIVGTHEVLFAGPDEMISLTHTATSKQIFATGAVNAALYICSRPKGLYNMGDLLS